MIVDYVSVRRRKIRWGLVALAGVVVFVMAWWVVGGTVMEREMWVCQEGGEVRIETHWLGMKWLGSSRVEATEVSEALKRLGIGAGHADRWVFVSLYGRGVLGRWWEDGSGGDVVENSRSMGGFLENLYRYGDAKTAEKWRRRCLDKSTARAAGTVFSGVDSEGMLVFATKKDFEAWWKAAEPQMEINFAAK